MSFLAALEGACTQPLLMRAPDLGTPLARLAVMPPSVVIYEMGVTETKPRPEWTSSGWANVDDSLRGWAQARGLKSFDASSMVDIPLPLATFQSWSERALLEIANRVEGRGYRQRTSVTEWHFPGNLHSWKIRLESDYVLMVLFRDAHVTGGVIALNMFSTVQTWAQQMGVACVIRLEDGRIVWCERRVDRYGDLRVRRSARSAVEQLVQLLPYLEAPRPRKEE
jgi:hypothetical protein